MYSSITNLTFKQIHTWNTWEVLLWTDGGRGIIESWEVLPRAGPFGLAQALEGSGPLHPSLTKMDTNPYPLRTMNHKHHAVLTWIVAHPDKYLYQCADALGYTPEWVRHLASTDLFQEQLAKARESIMQEAKGRLREKVMDVAGESMDSIQEGLKAKKPDLIDPSKTVRVASERFQVDAATMALKALGYINGNNASPGATTNIQIVLDPEKVVAAEKKLAAIQSN